MKVVVAEKVSPAALAVFREEPDWMLVTHDQIEGNLPVHLEDADALVVRSAVQVTEELLRSATRLRVIGRAGVGVDNINLDAATKKGIAVMNTPGGNAVAVAEHTFGLMLTLARGLSRADQTMHAGRWEKKSLEGNELRGKTLGIVGLGRIGMEVARRARAFQMNIVAHDPFVSSNVAHELGIKLMALEEIYPVADYLSLHVGLTPQTNGMINAETLQRLKKGVRIVNCARGELIDEGALAAAIASGHVAGAALDVFTVEPPKETPLRGLPNVILTPHIAGSTREAQEAVGVQIAQQVKEYLKRGVIQNSVNLPSLSDEEYALIKPYLELAERLGGFLAQLREGNVEEIGLRYSGEIAEWKTELIRNAAIKGILNQLSSEKANLVNAAKMATERGLKLHEEKKPKTSSGAARNVLTLRLSAKNEECQVKGGVLHGDSPRLLAVDDIDIEAPLADNLIFLRNRDVPGVIGRVGTILGEHHINIANFALGRRPTKPVGADAVDAVAVIHVDSKAPTKVIDALREIEAITTARAIQL